ncbi:MAG: ATP-binding protein [Oscillospiraceae bacterium]|nr:ATP-binding protein [Oscillospiraceae bacterium]
MKKRIYFNFLGLILLCSLLLSASVSGIMYYVIVNQEKAAIKDRAVLAADILNRGMDGSEGRYADYVNRDSDAARLTIIAPDGTVLLDNKAAATSMENHGDREEFSLAIQIGRGESTRYSGTLGASTYYYAIRLDDGNVLRVSMTVSSIVGTFTAILFTIAAVTVLVLLIANFAARRLARNILRPLSEIDFDGDNAAVYDELIPYAKKIDQQKREIAAQIAALKNRTDTIEVITGNMKEGLVLIDGAGSVLIANKSASKVFRESDMMQKSILHICRDIDFAQGVKQCLAGMGAELEMERGGNVYSVYFSPVRNGGEFNGGAILLFDITERYETEKQRREFSANVSHELKTPLTSISALAEMIENGMAKAEDVQGFAEKITVQARRLIGIIEDIIRLSEFDEGNVSREYSEFDVCELAKSVVEALREKAAEKRVAVGVTGDWLRVTANRRMIDELLYNLIDNAIKYNKENGEVTVALSREGDFCKIAVADTGIGISSEHHSRVFERFYRADKSRFKKTGGTGLGMSIVKHIAEHHGGRVELQSAEGEGTTVACWIAVDARL